MLLSICMPQKIYSTTSLPWTLWSLMQIVLEFLWRNTLSPSFKCLISLLLKRQVFLFITLTLSQPVWDWNGILPPLFLHRQKKLFSESGSRLFSLIKLGLMLKMDNNQLVKKISSIRFLKHNYIGSLLADSIPYRLAADSFFICNAEGSKRSGSHWVMVAKEDIFRNISGSCQLLEQRHTVPWIHSIDYHIWNQLNVPIQKKLSYDFLERIFFGIPVRIGPKQDDRFLGNFTFSES